MTDNLPAQKEKHFLTTLAKIAFIVIATIAVIFTVMANMGGSSDMLKTGVQDYISKVFGGKPTHVEKLVRLSFFPQVTMDIEGLIVTDATTDEKPVLRADKIRASMSFWNIARGNSFFTAFAIDNLEAEEGVLARKKFSIERIFIDHDKAQTEAVLKGYGKLGEDKWDLSMPLNVKGSDGKYSYRFFENRPFTFDIADIHIEGHIADRVHDYLKIENIKIRRDNTEIHGALTIYNLETGLLRLRGDLNFGQNSNIQHELSIETAKTPMKISGGIKSTSLVEGDLKGPGSPMGILIRLHEIFASEQKEKQKQNMQMEFLCEHDFDLKADIENMQTEEGAEALSFVYRQENGNSAYIPGTGDPAEASCRSGELFTIFN